MRDIPKRRGPPSTDGQKPGVMVPMADDELADIDAWIATRTEKMTRPEAIRRLALAKARQDVDSGD